MNGLPIMIDYVSPERLAPYRGLRKNDFAFERLAAALRNSYGCDSGSQR
jgi:hypothetical protein